MPTALQPASAPVSSWHLDGGTPAPVGDAEGLDLRPDPLQARTPAELSRALRCYRIWAGEPPYRELARRSGGEVAASTFCMMLRGETLPRLGLVLALVDACGGSDEDRQRFATAWRRIRLGRDAGETADAPEPPHNG
jgi:hypothetical protein